MGIFDFFNKSTISKNNSINNALEHTKMNKRASLAAGFTNLEAQKSFFRIYEYNITLFENEKPLDKGWFGYAIWEFKKNEEGEFIRENIEADSKIIYEGNTINIEKNDLKIEQERLIGIKKIGTDLSENQYEWFEKIINGDIEKVYSIINEKNYMDKSREAKGIMKKDNSEIEIDILNKTLYGVGPDYINRTMRETVFLEKNKKTEERYSIDNNGYWEIFKSEKDGSYKKLLYYPSGKLCKEIYSDGKIIKHKYYFENGSISAKFQEKDMGKFGSADQALLGGKKERDGEAFGLHLVFHENGKIKYESNYDGGVYHGPVKEYDENGSLVKESVYNWGNKENVERIYLHQIHTKGTLVNEFTEGHEIPFFDGAPKGAEQRAQRHILYELELDDDFDKENDDPHDLINWENILEVYYIEGYVGLEPPNKCKVLNIDIDDHREIEADYAYQWNGYGEDDSGVSKAKNIDEALETFTNYMKKCAKGEKEHYVD